MVAFALRTVLKGRTRGDGQSKSFIKFSNKVCRLVERSEMSEMHETKREEGKRDERESTNGMERDDGDEKDDQTKETRLLCSKYTLRNPADSAGNRRSGR